MTTFLTLLAAVSILQNIQSVNSIQSKIVTMFSIVLTQPMALEERQLIKFLVILCGAELHTVAELQMEPDHRDKRKKTNFYRSANRVPGTM